MSKLIASGLYKSYQSGGHRQLVLLVPQAAGKQLFYKFLLA